jgi:hypothetical protein
MAKPRVDMDKLGIPKAAAAAAVPFAKPPTPESVLTPLSLGVAKSLTVKLEAEDYWGAPRLLPPARARHEAEGNAPAGHGERVAGSDGAKGCGMSNDPLADIRDTLAKLSAHMATR